MNKNIFQKSAIITALLASLCCITPVLAVLGGITGIASTFDFLEPFRPVFITFTVIVLGLAFYRTYKPKNQNEIECECEEEDTPKNNFINSKKFLWIITFVSLALITFPYYSQVFFSDSTMTVKEGKVNYSAAKIEIEGMTCTGCEQSINYSLKSLEGVHSATSNYKTGIAEVKYDETLVKEKDLKKTIEENVGYKVKSIKKFPANENK